MNGEDELSERERMIADRAVRMVMKEREPQTFMDTVRKNWSQIVLIGLAGLLLLKHDFEIARLADLVKDHQGKASLHSSESETKLLIYAELKPFTDALTTIGSNQRVLIEGQKAMKEEWAELKKKLTDG